MKINQDNCLSSQMPATSGNATVEDKDKEGAWHVMLINVPSPAFEPVIYFLSHNGAHWRPSYHT